MEDTDFTLYLSSTDNVKNIPTNKPDHFTCLLNQERTLTGAWVCCVTDVDFLNVYSGLPKETPLPHKLCMCCDICGASFVYGDQKQILCRINVFPYELLKREHFPNPRLVEIVKTHFNSITFSVLNEYLKPSGLAGDIDFVLRFYKL